MVEEKKLKMPTRYSKEELSLLKNTFAGKDDLLIALRKLLLQINLSEEESSFKEVFNEQVVNVLRKVILPELTGGEQLYMATDLWSKTVINLDDKRPEEIERMLDARHLFIKYIDQQLNILAGNFPETLFIFKDLDYNPLAEGSVRAVNLMARQTILTHIENHLMQIRILANQEEDETPEETLKRLSLDSSE